MSKFTTSIALVNVTKWNNEDASKPLAILLKAISGKVPNKGSIMAQSFAEMQGFELNKTYLVQIDEREANEYGRQFSFTNLGAQSGLDIIKVSKELGTPVVVDVINEVAATTVEEISLIGQTKEKASK